MGIIRKITQETGYRFLNFFTFDVTHKNGKESKYFVASRAKKAEELKASKAEIEAEFYAYLLSELTAEEANTFVALLDRLYLASKTESRAGFPHLLAVAGGGEV